MLGSILIRVPYLRQAPEVFNAGFHVEGSWFGVQGWGLGLKVKSHFLHEVHLVARRSSPFRRYAFSGPSKVGLGGLRYSSS